MILIIETEIMEMKKGSIIEIKTWEILSIFENFENGRYLKQS